MNTLHLHICLFAALPLAFSGCSSSGVSWGEEAGGGAGSMSQVAAANGETVRTGSISTNMINATVVIIAEHEATEKQRRLAEERAHAWLAAQRKQEAQAAATPSHHAGQKAAKPQPAKHKRYIAVDTSSDSRTAPQAQKSVMIFDTQADQVVGKNVYDVQSPPPVGGIARFETYSAQYVGPGL